MKALVELRDWEALETFAKSKKSPIGYEPFVSHLISTGSHRQAVAFIARCEGKNRVELYVKTGEWVMAGQECVRRSEKKRLRDLAERCPNNVVRAQIEQLYEEMEQAGM